MQAFYPTDALVTARDIIFLWVARMIMIGIEFTGQIPFTDVYVHSIIQAPDGRRMSKSLGTGIDPMDLIEGGPRPPVFAQGGQPAGDFPAYGADAVRWGLLAMSSTQDVKFSEDKVAQGQQLTNKLWNASRLILLGVGEDVRAAITPRTVEDRWILSRLERAKADTSARIERFDFSHAALGLYDFVYGELCDWYLELVKPRLRAGEPELAGTLLHVLTQTLALAHPIMPFVTEEIYSYVPGADGLLAAGIPDAGEAGTDVAAEATVARLIEAVQALRTWRDQAGVRAGRHASRPARCQRRLRGHGRAPAAARARGVRRDRRRRAAGRVGPDPGRCGRDPRLRRARPRGRGPQARRPARAARSRDPARRAQAVKRRLRGQGAEGRRRRRARQADPTARGAGGAVTPEDAERYLLSLELFGMRFGLDRMQRLMTALGHPQRRFASIHVVGTNGKSSTVRMIAAILRRHGLRTGAYLSPHLVSFGERIRIDDEDLEPAAFAAAVQRAAHAARARRPLAGGPTTG